MRWLSAVVSLLLLLPGVSVASGYGGGRVGGVGKPPNVLIWMIDDTSRETYQNLGNFDTSGRFGAPSTPRIDSLAQNGINFTGMWSGPLCNPSRTMLRFGALNRATDTGIDTSIKRRIQDQSGNAYQIIHMGKDIFGHGVGTNGPANHRWAQAGALGPVGGGGQSEGTAWWNQRMFVEANDDASDSASGYYYPSASNLYGYTYSAGDASSGGDSYDTTTNEYLGGSTAAAGQGTKWQHVDETYTDLVKKYLKEDVYNNDTVASHRARPWLTTVGLHSSHTSSHISQSVPTAEQQEYYEAARDLTVYADRWGPATIGGSGVESWVQGSALGGTGEAYNSSYAARGLTLPVAVSGVPLGCPGYSYAQMQATAGDYTAWTAYNRCFRDQTEWADELLGQVIDYLGEEKLRDTLVVFVGDNGTTFDNLNDRDGLIFGADDPIPASGTDPSDGTGYCEFTSGGTTQTVCGKGTHSESGINVPFVVAYGPVAKSNYGTTAKMRANFADVSETVLQMTAPGAGSTPDGRDFSQVLSKDCSSGQCDALFGTTLSQNNAGDSCKLGEAIVADEDSSGRIYRLWRTSCRADYLVDLAAADPNADLRSQANSPGDVKNAYDALVSALVASPNSQQSEGPL